MKVLLVAGGFVHAGVSRVLSLISKGLVELGHEVDIYFIKPVSSSPYTLYGSVVHTGGFGAGCRLVKEFALWRFLINRGNSYDRIIGFSEDANISLIKISRLLKLNDKVILSVHNPVNKFSERTINNVKKYYGSAYKVIGVSRGVVSGLKSLGLPSSNLVFRPNPVDISAIKEASSQEPEITLDNTVFNYIAVGRLHPHKGFDLLIDAFKNIAQENVRLTILGEGEERKHLEQKIKEYGLEGNVFLPGSVNNPFAVMVQSDCFVLSSRLEGWPMVLMEAMAVGLPVVSFACPHGPDEILENGKYGLLVDTGNIKALSNSMNQVLMNIELNEKLKRVAEKRVQEFDYVKVVKTWIS